VSYTLDFAPTWMRRYSFRAKVSAIVCAGLMSFIAVVPGLGSPINDVAAIANAFGRVPPSPVSATPFELILFLHPQAEALNCGTSQQASSQADSRLARIMEPMFTPIPLRPELNQVPRFRCAGTVITDTEQINIDGDVRAIHAGSGTISSAGLELGVWRDRARS
jgi:hypothetical protein